MAEIAGGTSSRRQQSRRSGISVRGGRSRDVGSALHSLSQNVASQTGRLDSHPALRRVRRFVENRLTEPLPLSRVARVASLEETYFSATFSESVGVPYTEWLSGLRVLEAAELLRGGQRSLESIADQAGFGHVRSLQRAFRRRLGLSPREVRRQVRRDAVQA
jgi:transcriptional regulator GlxA family with amidase domain